MEGQRNEGDRPLPPSVPGAKPSGAPGGFEPEMVAGASGSDSESPGYGAFAEPAGAPETNPRRRRTTDASAIAAMAVGLPWLVYSFAVVSTVAGLLVQGVSLVVVCSVWLLSGTLVFFSATDEVIARLIFRARPPTEREQTALEPSWQDVIRAARVDGQKYRVWVEDIDDLNASASGGHVVTVTRQAIEAMPARQLAAVLAHELGHHMGGHPWSKLLTYWYSLPARLFTAFTLWLVPLLIRAVFVVISFAMHVSSYIPSLANAVQVLFLVRIAIWFILGLFALFAVLAAIAVLLTPIGWIIAAGLAALVLLPSWLSRVGEYHADRFAADIGYGDALVDALEDWLSMGVEDVGEPLRDRLLSTHPPPSKRINRVNAHLHGTSS